METGDGLDAVCVTVLNWYRDKTNPLKFDFPEVTRSGAVFIMRSSCCSILCLVLILALCPYSLRAQDELPKVVDSRLKIELYAEHPQIVTPTGIDVDHEGRVWALESNTHFPPEGYAGHKSDRLLVMSGQNPQGRASQIAVFADGFTHAMSVAVRPPWYPVPARVLASGQMGTPKISVYLATRREIIFLQDDEGDLKADRQERLVHLETAGNYPHNGLAGLAIDPSGWLYFGFGENLGADYKIIGQDGTTLQGGGEGGNLYRCRLDGTELTPIATGFWNPHATCIDAFGRIFSVDNDPDSRPPCRLLHIIPMGDYGYRFRNGRKGLHPFTAWNGEIPGTLPMVAGTGEAPSGIVAYESDGFPADYIGNLLVGTWGDHRIDRFRLTPKGTSFTSLAEPIITGNENFRPVGLAIAPDGSLFFSDWVSRDYKLHGKGRIWRVSSLAPRTSPTVELNSLTGQNSEELYRQLTSPRMPVRRMAAYLLANDNGPTSLAGRTLLATQIPDRVKSTRSRIEATWALANLSRSAKRPDDLLPLLRTLVVGGSGTSLAGGSAANEVQTAARWLQDSSLSEQFPSYGEVIRLAATVNRDASSRGREQEEYSLPVRYFQARTFDPTTAAQDWFSAADVRDPFLFALVVEQCARVDSPERLKEWWSAQTNPSEGNQRRFNVGLSPELLSRAESRRTPPDATVQVIVLGARKRFPKNTELLTLFLKDSRTSVRTLAVQWAAEEKLIALRPLVADILNSTDLDRNLFLATLAALEMLDGISPVEFDKTPSSKYVLPMLTKTGVSPAARLMALRMADPTDPALTSDLMKSLLADASAGVRLEAIRSLQQSIQPVAQGLLRSVVADQQQEIDSRAEALVGLGRVAPGEAPDSETRTVIDRLLRGDNSTLRIEAVRALRGASAAGKPSPAILQLIEKWSKNEINVERMSEWQELGEHLRLAVQGTETTWPTQLQELNRPRDLDHWQGLASSWVRQLAGQQNNRRNGEENEWRLSLQAPQYGGFGGRPRATQSSGDVVVRLPNATAGRRVFFSANSAGCAKCHTVEGRGGKLGPDLTTISRTMPLAKLVESILTPSQEMSPQFVPWSFELTSGQVVTGLILSEESEKLKIGLPDATIQELKLAEIASRTPQTVSFMPEKLYQQLTSQEFLDLVTFLETLK